MTHSGSMLLCLLAEEGRKGCFGKFFPFGYDGNKEDVNNPEYKEIQVKHRDAVPQGNFTEKSQQPIIERKAAKDEKHQQPLDLSSYRGHGQNLSSVIAGLCGNRQGKA